MLSLMGTTTNQQSRLRADRTKRRAVRAYACAALTGMLGNRVMGEYTVEEIVETALHFGVEMANAEGKRLKAEGGAR